jgi:hypothetical protein
VIKVAQNFVLLLKVSVLVAKANHHPRGQNLPIRANVMVLNIFAKTLGKTAFLLTAT